MSTPVVTRPVGPSLLRAVLARRSGAVGAALVGLVALAALVAAVGLLGDPAAQQPAARLTGPSATFWLGTDQFGRDVAVRAAAAAGTSLLVALGAVGAAAVLGSAIGLAAGYRGGWPDRVAGAGSAVLFAFPPLLLALVLAAALPRSPVTTALAIAVVYTPIFVRVVRGPVLALREADFVAATTVLGFSGLRTVLAHVLPNLTGVLVVQVTLSLSWAVLTEASLSFLGLGTPPPAASLGAMVLEARVLAGVAPWTMAVPGAVLVALVVGFNLLGDGLRDALDPRRGGHR